MKTLTRNAGLCVILLCVETWALGWAIQGVRTVLFEFFMNIEQLK